MFKDLKKGIIIALSFAFTLGLIGVTYAAWVNLTDVGPGDTLTADIFNKVLENQRVLSLSSIPSTAVIAFNATTCPTGWSEYTPAYGRFIRGIDKSTTNIDPDGQRALGDIKDDVFESHNHTVNPASVNTNTTGNHTHGVRLEYGNYGSVSYPPGSQYSQITSHLGFGYLNTNTMIQYSGDHTHSIDIPQFNSGNIGGTETSPKNVALLYCVKD